jgi:hypothetical protein
MLFQHFQKMVDNILMVHFSRKFLIWADIYGKDSDLILTRKPLKSNRNAAIGEDLDGFT